MQVCQLLNTKRYMPHTQITFAKERKLTSTNLHKDFSKFAQLTLNIQLAIHSQIAKLNHSKQNTFIIRLWYSSSSGIFCRVQSNAFLSNLFQYNNTVTL